MKLISPILFAFIACLASAGEVEIIVKPEKGVVARNEEIDIEIFILNDTAEEVQIPAAGDDKGYSVTSIDFETVLYDIVGGKLELRGMGSEGRGVTHQGTVKLKPRDSRSYKFRWTAPDSNFDILILKPTFFVDGDFAEGRTTLTLKPQQDGADQPATAPESKPEGKEKPKPESEARPQ